MPPAPALGTVELDEVIAEVYALALLRDVSFLDIANRTTKNTPSGILVNENIDALSVLEWYANTPIAGLNVQQRRRRTARYESHADHDVNNPPNNGYFNRKDAFRVSSPGVKSGPYVSQYMLQGSRMVNDDTGDSDRTLCND